MALYTAKGINNEEGKQREGLWKYKYLKKKNFSAYTGKRANFIITIVKRIFHPFNPNFFVVASSSFNFVKACHNHHLSKCLYTVYMLFCVVKEKVNTFHINLKTVSLQEEVGGKRKMIYSERVRGKI